MADCPVLAESENPNPVASKGDQIGVDLAALSRYDSIVVHIANSDYRILLTDPGDGRALLQGGRQLTEPVEAWILGSSIAGSVLRNGWICVGYHMDAWAKRQVHKNLYRAIVTSRANVVSTKCEVLRFRVRKVLNYCFRGWHSTHWNVEMSPRFTGCLKGSLGL